MKEIDDVQEQKISEWMQTMAEQTAPPRDLPTPGLLLFKARLIEKRIAAARAIRSLVWMRTAALAVFFLASLWLVSSGRSPLAPLFRDTLSSLMSVAVLFIFGAIAATAICLGFALILRRTNDR